MVICQPRNAPFSSHKIIATLPVVQYMQFLHIQAKLHTSVFRNYKETPVMMMSVQANRQG